MHIVNDSC